MAFAMREGGNTLTPQLGASMLSPDVCCRHGPDHAIYQAERSLDDRDGAPPLDPNCSWPSERSKELEARVATANTVIDERLRTWQACLSALQRAEAGVCEAGQDKAAAVHAYERRIAELDTALGASAPPEIDRFLEQLEYGTRPCCGTASVCARCAQSSICGVATQARGR